MSDNDGSGEMTPSPEVRPTLVLVLCGRQAEISRTIQSVEGIERLAPGIYRTRTVRGQPMSEIAEHRCMIFRRVRRVPKLNERDAEAIDRRTCTLVAYRLTDTSSRQKKKMMRLIARTPSVRVRPGVLIYPYLRKKDLERLSLTGNDPQLYSSVQLAKHLRELGADVMMISRLRTVDESSLSLLDETIDTMIERELTSVDNRARQMLDALQCGSQDPRVMRRKYADLRHRFAQLRRGYELIGEVWHHDAGRRIKRSYNLILRVRRLIDERTTTHFTAGLVRV
ncbi:MAG: hypothetical protein QXS20_08540 [Candidatus Thorarchaeota archaeon]